MDAAAPAAAAAETVAPPDAVTGGGGRCWFLAPGGTRVCGRDVAVAPASSIAHRRTPGGEPAEDGGRTGCTRARARAAALSIGDGGSGTRGSNGRRKG